MAARDYTQASKSVSIASSEQALAACQELEGELVELNVAWEQYFLGNERTPPSRRHEKYKRRLRDLKNQFHRQTAVKFRITNLQQKFATYERMWTRTVAEIEVGIYHRDVYKAKRKAAKAEARKESAAGAADTGEDPDFEVDEDVDLSDEDGDLDSALAAAASAVSAPRPLPAVAPVVKAPAVAAKPAAAAAAPAKPAAPVGPPKISAPLAVKPAAGAQARPPAPAAAAAGLSDQKIKAIYDAYVTAKRRCGEDTTKLSLDSVASTLRNQVPTLLKQHKARTVEFKVVIKDGKAVLRALPKE